MIGLNAGCGDHAAAGWVNLDAWPSASAAQIFADVRGGLPFASGTIDRVFASHLLEHLAYFDDAWEALAEFRRVLRPGGRLGVICPDIERAVMLGEPPVLLRQIIAWPDEWVLGDWPAKRPPAGHAWTATSVLVGRLIESAGFRLEADLSGRLPEMRALGWPVTNLSAWQCAFTAIP